jgi:type VI protein secretion system component VasK
VNRRRDTAEAVTGILILGVIFAAVRLFVAGPVVSFYFGWPNGAVWSNLVASLICAVLVWWRVRARLIAHHAQQLAQAAAHHKAQIALAREHHEALKRHIAAAAQNAAIARHLKGAGQ